MIVRRKGKFIVKSEHSGRDIAKFNTEKEALEKERMIRLFSNLGVIKK